MHESLLKYRIDDVNVFFIAKHYYIDCLIRLCESTLRILQEIENYYIKIYELLDFPREILSERISKCRK